MSAALLCCLSGTVYCQTGVYVEELKLFDAKMNDLISKYDLVGGQIAITYQERLVYNRGFGIADTNSMELVQPHSIFRLASVSKPVTSIAIMTLVGKGLIDLDAIVLGNNGIIDDVRYQNAIDNRMYQFTVRQLLNHSSGFNYDFANEPLWKTYEIAIAMGVTPSTISFEHVLEWTLQNKSLGFQPGTSAGYSNFGYTLLGLVVETVTGLKYESYVRDSILIPLGISDMHAGRTLEKDKYTNEVVYYDYKGAPLLTSIYTGIPNSIPAQYGGYSWEIMTPAGGWVASAQDLCKLLTAVDGLNKRADILRRTTLDTMWKRSTHWPDYGLGWFVSAEDQYHTGGIQGTATVVRTDNVKSISYAILFNALPQVYTAFYYEFIDLVSEEFVNIQSWPSHDLFDAVSSVRTQEEISSVRVYPNPASTLIHINNLPEGFTGSVHIYNVVGQQVLSRDIDGSHSSLSVEMLWPGMYMLSIVGEGGFVERKTFFMVNSQ